MQKSMLISSSSIDQIEIAPAINSIISLSQGLVTMRHIDTFNLIATHPLRNIRKFCVTFKDFFIGIILTNIAKLVEFLTFRFVR